MSEMIGLIANVITILGGNAGLGVYWHHLVRVYHKIAEPNNIRADVALAVVKTQPWYDKPGLGVSSVQRAN